MITLMTDFGTDSPYIAAMKAVIYECLPSATLIDLTHGIPPQNIKQGAFIWYDFTQSFPAGTVHVGVVDPGVGSNRRIVAARYREQFWVCPDNGLLTFFLWDREPDELVEITNPAYWRNPVSSTFHGRDIMAPVAAAIADGIAFSELGTVCDSNRRPRVRPCLLPVSRPVFAEKEWQLEVLFVDHFGNLLLNATMSILPKDVLSQWEAGLNVTVRAGNRDYPAVFARTYSCRQAGNLVLLAGSSDRLEVATVNGCASQELVLGEGDRLTVTWD